MKHISEFLEQSLRHLFEDRPDDGEPERPKEENAASDKFFLHLRESCI